MVLEKERIIRKYIVGLFIEKAFDEILGPSGYTVIAFHVKTKYNRDIIDIFVEDPKKALVTIQESLGIGEYLSEILERSLSSYIEKILEHPLKGDIYNKDEFYVLAKKCLLKRNEST